MGRRTTRESAFKLLYQMEFQKGDEEAQIDSYLEEYAVDPKEKDYFLGVVRGVTAHKEEIDALFSKHLKGWSLNRLPRIDLAILRIAVYEILFLKEVPFSVSVNEAVELAHKYSAEESRGYINAVLGKLEPAVPHPAVPEPAVTEPAVTEPGEPG
jgi:N utilization substance protein B